MIFIAAAIDGSTKSRAREIPRRFEDGRPAPGPLRSEVYPDGLPHLSGRDAQRVDTDNKACNYMSSQRSKSCETVGEGVSVRTQPVHSIGGLRLRWRCGSPDNGWTRPTQCARWVALVASIKYFGTTWRRFSSGPRSANCHVTYMTRKSGRHTRAMASECTHPRRRLSTQQSWRLPSRCQPVGGQFERAWLRCRCRECQHFSQWGAGSIGLTWILTQ